MKPNILFFSFVLSILVGCNGSDISGRWTGNNNEYSFNFLIIQNDKKVTGSGNLNDKFPIKLSGLIFDNDISLTFSVNKIEISFIGEIVNDSEIMGKINGNQIKFQKVASIADKESSNESIILTEENYYLKAKEAYKSNEFQNAVSNFKSLVVNYPKSKHRAEALFLLGFIYSNDLQNYDQGKLYYEQFIREFPNHDLVDDAEYELKTLGKTINELPIFEDNP